MARIPGMSKAARAAAKKRPKAERAAARMRRQEAERMHDATAPYRAVHAVGKPIRGRTGDR